MIAPGYVVKNTARTVLFQSPIKSIAVCCVMIFSVFIAELISSLASAFAGIVGYAVSMCLISFFGLIPLGLGVVYYFMRLAVSQNDSVLIIFKYFSGVAEYKRVLTLLRILAFRFLSVGIVLFLPCIIVAVLSMEKFYSLFDTTLPIWASNLWALNSLLAFLASLVLLFVMLKYYLAAYIFVVNDDVKPLEAINKSTVISKRTGADFVGLLFTFFGWILISVFVLPLVFTVPYFIAAYCVHCRYAITAYNSDVDRFNADITPHYSSDEN